MKTYYLFRVIYARKISLQSQTNESVETCYINVRKLIDMFESKFDDLVKSQIDLTY